MAETPQDIIPHIFLDTSGELRNDVFYRVTFDNDELYNSKPDEVHVPLKPSLAELIKLGQRDYANTLFETSFDLLVEAQHNCPYDDGHITQHWWNELKVIYIDGTPPPLIALNSDRVALLMHDDFMTKLGQSGLIGWNQEEVIFATQEGEEHGRTSDPGKYPKYWYLQFRGEHRLRTMSVRNAKNSCPHCGYGVIYCPGCQRQQSECPQCKKIPWQSMSLYLNPQRKARRGPLVKEAWPNPVAPRGILEGEHWDGSDFIQIAYGWGHGPIVSDRYILTKRALDWLIAHNMAPIQAGPIHVDVSRMSSQQLKKLEDAKDLKSLEKKGK